MEIVLGIISSVLATCLIASASFIWKQRNDLKKQLSVLALSGKGLPQIGGIWHLLQQTEEHAYESLLTLKQYGRAIKGFIDNGAFKLKIDGTFDGKMIVGHFWGETKFSQFSGSLTMKLSKNGQELYGQTTWFDTSEETVKTTNVIAKRS